MDFEACANYIWKTHPDCCSLCKFINTKYFWPFKTFANMQLNNLGNKTWEDFINDTEMSINNDEDNNEYYWYAVDVIVRYKFFFLKRMKMEREFSDHVIWIILGSCPTSWRSGFIQSCPAGTWIRSGPILSYAAAGPVQNIPVPEVSV